MQRLIYLLLLAFLLAACSNLFAPAPSPTATEIPVPECFTQLPSGILPVLINDVWNFTTIDGELIPDFTYDSSGFHLTLEGGSVDLSIEQAGRLKLGQGDVLQVYNEVGTAIDYAYDKEENRWLAHDEVIQTDKTNPENYIKVATWEEMQNLFRQEKMFMLPFPEDTYWPDPSKIILDYMNSKVYGYGSYEEEDFNFFYPLGKYLTEANKSPFRFVNFINLQEGEGRTNSIFIITEQVYNPDDASFSSLHFGVEYWKDYQWVAEYIDQRTSGYSEFGLEVNAEYYLLPIYKVDPRNLTLSACQNALKLLRDEDIDLKSDGSMPEMKALVNEWLTKGHLPLDLELIIHFDSPKSFLLQ